MKFSTVPLSLAVASLSAGCAMATDYTFDCGTSGGGTISLSQGNMGFAVALENLDTDIGRSEGDTLGYHLHTMWSNSGNSETLAQCAGFFTGGHYDPTYRCGPASQASKTNQCKNADYANCSPSQPSACEFGDLSGKYGKLVIDGNHEAAISVTGDTQGAKPQHYVLSNGIAEALVVHSLS